MPNIHMIILRAPLRISFVGGGTDLPAFYRISAGRVISAAIDKYVYVAINPTPLIKRVVARYSTVEMVHHSRELKNDRIREALLDLGIKSNIEIGTFSHMHVGTGLGGSSSFSVALMKGLYSCLGRILDEREAAEAACRLEIDLVKEPIGKQDQFIAAFGGCNIFQFNPDESVEVDPLRLDLNARRNLEQHLLLCYTGIPRSAAVILRDQNAAIHKRLDTLKAMAESVDTFRTNLLAGYFEKMGMMLHQGWLQKKSLAPSISNAVIDEFYDSGMQAGAWGGKVLGAGGGGCILFMAPRESKDKVREALQKVANAHQLDDFQKIPFHFVQSGVEILSNTIPQSVPLWQYT